MAAPELRLRARTPRRALKLYGAMNDFVSALPKPLCSHSRKLRGGDAAAAASGGLSVARSATISATSASGSRHTFA